MDLPTDATGAGNDFEALEKLRRPAFADQVEEPLQLELWKQNAVGCHMPIPDFDHNGVLPPHIGDHAANRGHMSPYSTTSAELCTKLGTTDERRQILLGFFELRAALRQLGVTSGFQWLDGSFVEDAERTRGRAPADSMRARTA